LGHKRLSTGCARGDSNATERAAAGIYNVAEPDGTVRIDKAISDLGWSPDFRVQ
jgi:hypothetical protein